MTKSFIFLKEFKTKPSVKFNSLPNKRCSQLSKKIVGPKLIEARDPGIGRWRAPPAEKKLIIELLKLRFVQSESYF